jgi:ferritin-like metal-binding protein YciE
MEVLVDLQIQEIKMELATLQDLLIDELEDIYDAEHQLLKALPKMANTATSPDLKKSFETHLTQTESHVQRLEQVFKIFGEEPERKTCKAMKGLIAEGAEVIKEDATPEVKDVALIASAQRVEHYEMAAYGCAKTYAEELGKLDAVELLDQTLKEEKQTDSKLTKLAVTVINLKPAKN